jgi:hypothetical protein
MQQYQKAQGERWHTISHIPDVTISWLAAEMRCYSSQVHMTWNHALVGCGHPFSFIPDEWLDYCSHPQPERCGCLFHCRKGQAWSKPRIWMCGCCRLLCL